MKSIFNFSVLMFSLAAELAYAGVSIKSVERAEFNPVRRERTAFIVATDEPGDLTLQLFTADGDLMREWKQAVAKPGDVRIEWDGRDPTGAVVPDEAYTPVALLKQAGKPDAVDDPRQRSGGETLDKLQVSVSDTGDVSYTLPAPARVLMRAGIKGGAMLRSLTNWAARPIGRNIQRWNGFDADGLIDLRNDRLAILVTAFKLPDFSVITAGNTAQIYRAYRLARGWSEDQAMQSQFPLERNGQRLTRHYFFPRYKDREPGINVAMLDDKGTRLKGSPATAPDKVRVQVDIDEADRWLMEETLYEVAFFVDGDFVSEEEHGYVPIGWVWDLSNLKPGKHLLTVNVTGFLGKVGVKSVSVTR